VDSTPTTKELPLERSKIARRNVEHTLEKLMLGGKRPLLKTFVIDHGPSARRCGVMEDKVM
jgi:hypothetical protein